MAVVSLLANPGKQTDSLEIFRTEYYPVSTDSLDTNIINNLFNVYYKYRQSEPVKALSYLQKAQIISQELGIKSKTAVVLYHKGYLYRSLGIYNLSLKSYMKSLKIYEEEGDSNLVAWVLLDIGNLYFNQKTKLSIAFEHYQKAFEAFKKSGNKEGLIVTGFNLGLTCRDQGKYDLSINYFSDALKLCEESKDDYRKAFSLSYIGQVYLRKGMHDKAREYFDASFKINKEKQYKDGLAYTYSDYASISLAEKKYDRALEDYAKSLSLYKEVNDKLNISGTLEKISVVHARKENYAAAVEYALFALAVADSNNLITIQQEILPAIADYYSKQRDYTNAFTYLKKYNDLKQSDINTILNQTQTEYEMEAAQHKAEFLKKENELKDSEIKQQRIIIYTVLCGLLIVVGLLILLLVRSNQLKKSNLHLFKTNVEIMNKEKELIEIKNSHKYSRSQLSHEENQTMLDNLLELMNSEKMYLNNQLTIEEVAKKLGTNRTYLSQIINEKFNANFNNFINKYRVKEAQQMLLMDSNKAFTIESIANAAGFHSKSSFNTAFKKFTGLTPSDFIRLKNQPPEAEDKKENLPLPAVENVS